MFVRPFMATGLAIGLAVFCAAGASQETAGSTPSAPQAPAAPYVVASGTTVPLSLINTISTKHSAVGDRVYLETAFPVVVNSRIVIPVGSYVAGTVSEIKRPGRVKGRGELFVRFDSLTLPNGVTREFRARVNGADGHSNQELENTEGKVISEGNKGGDARTVAETATAGASIGSVAGAAAGHVGMGLGIGAAAGAAAGLIGVLATRGPDAVLPRGSTVDMVLDRPLAFTEVDLNFGNYQPPRMGVSGVEQENARPPVIARRPLPY
jgi:type IV secretion system protein VirB10